MNSKPRSRDVMLDDVAKHRQQKPQRVLVAGRFQVTLDGVEVPERRVGRVIQTFALPLGKQIGNQPVANVAGEGPQDVASLGRAGRSPGSSPSRLIIVSRPQSVNQ